jgi:16S rRNA (cytosine967-C5)-methyltransferase
MNARDLALEVLRRVFTQGSFASAALRSAFDRARDLPQNDRALATELVYGVLRRRGHLDRALTRMGKRLKDLDPRIHDILRLGAYQIIFLDRIPAHAAVSEAVDQAKHRAGPKAGGQVNAILRKLSTTSPEERIGPLPDRKREPARHVSEAGSIPLPLAEVLVADLGFDAALAFVIASLEIAPLTLRANRLKTTREALAEEVGGTPGGNAWSVRLPAKAGGLPADLLAVVEGRATPQDEASMSVVELLDPQEGEKILDVCAAPGGKTTHAAEVMRDRGRIVAHDRLPERLARVAEQAKRLELSSIETVPILPPIDELFDRVLVDAPCTGLGTLRRHPEIRWRCTKDQILELAKIQSEVLKEGAARVKPGGTLVYAVCTVTKAEGEAHLSELEGFDVAELVRTSPEQTGAPDGFFAAKLIRRKLA